MIFVLFSCLSHATVHKFPNFFVHDNYMLSRHFESVIVTWQIVTIAGESTNQIARNVIYTDE